MHNLSKVRMLTDALSECVGGNCAGLFSYIDDAWEWEYDEKEMKFSVNLQFFPDALADAMSHGYTGFQFVDGYVMGLMEIRLAVFKLRKPLPHLEKF